MCKFDQRIKKRQLTAVWLNGGFSAFLETFVLNQSLGIFSNFGAVKPPLRQAADRCAQYYRRDFQTKFMRFFNSELTFC